MRAAYTRSKFEPEKTHPFCGYGYLTCLDFEVHSPIFIRYAHADVQCVPMTAVFPLSNVLSYRQEHAHELNGVLISNRLAHAELLGTMEKQDFAFAVGIRRYGNAIWRRRCGGWGMA